MRTQNLLVTSFNWRILLLALLLSILPSLTNAQHAITITDVEPRRVTEGVTITIRGTGFRSGDQNRFKVNSNLNDDGPGIGLSFGNRKFVNATTITVDVGWSVVSNQTNPYGSGASYNDRTVNLVYDYNRDNTYDDTGDIAPILKQGTTEEIKIEYIAPTAMIQAKNNFEGRIPIPVSKRVQEIYTDYGGVKTYQDGDAFNNGDFNSSTYGRWEFFDLVFPATPRGVLVEAGGRGRGMFIGFNNAGNFVARGGDGRPPGTPTPNGTARIQLPSSTFAGKSGRLLVTLDPREGQPTSGQLTIEWDEGNDGSIEYSNTVNAALPYLGYDSFREWSGGDAGFVGNSNGNIAGSEITSNYNFNGTIGSMTFSNFADVPIAWRSSQGTYSGQPSSERPDNPVIPDNYHDLLGFKINGIVYSTGANNGLLEEFLDDEIVNTDGTPKSNYIRQKFKAYSTNGVQNTTVSQHHIFTGEYVDGREVETPTEFLTAPNSANYDAAYANIKGLSMFDVLIDGKNGLNIGSGINNLNQSTSIQFFSGNGQFGAVADGKPDLLIPNMAEAGGTDVYYYTDELGNVIGRPISIRINNSDSNNPPLSHWQNDQYSVTLGVSFNQAQPSRRIYGDRQERPMRLIAFTLEDFGISGEATVTSSNKFTNIQSIFNINAGAGGTADIPFLAYNGETFAIKSPVVTNLPTPRSVCAVPSNILVEFEIEAEVEGGFSTDPTELAKETLRYEWFQYNSTLGDTDNTFNINGVDASDLGLYRVRIYNDYGATIVTVAVEEGGTPAIWNGSSWTYPSGFVAAGGNTQNGKLTPVADADRRLIFSESYNVSSSDLEGCDCLIPAGSVVEVSNGRTLKLYDEVILSPEEPDVENVGSMIPAGQLIIHDNGTLLQTKDTNVNDNQGDMTMYRQAENNKPYDFVFWSSPVDTFDVKDIPNLKTYLWNVRAPNARGTEGDWEAYNGNMKRGSGYIAMVPSTSAFQATFTGVPNNGLINVGIGKTVDVTDNNMNTLPLENRHWNLVGNPYPSAISVEKFLTNSVNSNLIEGAVYLWSRATGLSTTNPRPFYANTGVNYNSDDYILANGTGTNPNRPEFEGNIAAGQGFFVKVLESVTLTPTDSLQFRNTMRYGASQSALSNNVFYRNSDVSSSNEKKEKQLLWLSLIDSQSFSSSTLIGYLDGASNEKDRLYDAYTNRGDAQLSIHSILDDAQMEIQGRALPFDEKDYVKLGVQIPENGVYKIGIDQLQGTVFEDENINIILEDTHLGIMHNLRDKPYSFAADAGKFNERFILKYTANQLSTNEVELPETLVFIKDKVLNIQSSKIITEVQVYDISGKRVISLDPKRNLNRFQTNFNFSRGVYIAIITLDHNIRFSKKLIN